MILVRTGAARRGRLAGALAIALAMAACREPAAPTRARVSGYVEATDVRVAPEVGGRLLELTVHEGQRVAAGDVVARLETTDVDLALRRARAEREQAGANLRLLRAGARAEDIRQAQAQVGAAEAELASARAELASAETDRARFESLLAANAGSRRQRDEAATRRDVAAARVRAADERLGAARAVLARLHAGARRQEIDAAAARVAGVEAQIASLERDRAEAEIRAPLAGVVTETLIDPGELAAPRTPILVVTDLDRAWANVYLDQPLVPRVRLNQPATVFTDAGGPGLAGTVTFISPRAEFTPRNVQTQDERAKLVYRIKISVDNREGILKPGMPVEAEIPLAPTDGGRD